VVEHDGPPGDAPDQFAVMGGDEHGRPAGVDLPEQVHDFQRQVRIEIAGGLVRQHDLRIVHERPGDRDALLLTPRQLLGQCIHAMLQPHPLEHLECLPLPLREPHAEHAHDERHVLEDAEPRNQPEVLEDEPECPAIALHLRRREIRKALAVDLQAALARQLFAEQQSQKRRLAGPARTRQEEEFALVDREREVAKRIDAPAIELGEVIGFYHATSAEEWTEEPEYSMGYPASSPRLSSSFTLFGFALPPVAFIT
jgi:hypothetical protein